VHDFIGVLHRLDRPLRPDELGQIGTALGRTYDEIQRKLSDPLRGRNTGLMASERHGPWRNSSTEEQAAFARGVTPEQLESQRMYEQLQRMGPLSAIVFDVPAIPFIVDGRRQAAVSRSQAPGQPYDHRLLHRWHNVVKTLRSGCRQRWREEPEGGHAQGCRRGIAWSTAMPSSSPRTSAASPTETTEQPRDQTRFALQVRESTTG
jgi:hypothetical protein